MFHSLPWTPIPTHSFICEILDGDQTQLVPSASKLLQSFEMRIANDEHESPESVNVWFHLRKGESQPAIDLFRMLERDGCFSAATGFLKDLAEKIVDAEGVPDRGRFVETANDALCECLRDDPNAPARYLSAARRIRPPKTQEVFRFRLIHLFVVTAVCAVAVSFVGSLTAIAIIYCCVLVFVLPLYASSLYRAYRGHTRSANNALLTSATVLLAFLFAMTRVEIREFYPLSFWCIPPTLVLAAAYVHSGTRRRLLIQPLRDNTSPTE